jgi:hypothetical protein
MTSTQHIVYFCMHEHEKFKNAIRINRSHSRTLCKTYDATQRHGDLPPQSDYSTTSTSSIRCVGNKSRRKTLCLFTEQRQTWWKPKPKTTTSATTRRLRKAEQRDQEQRPRIEKRALQICTRKWRIATSRAGYQHRGHYSYSLSGKITYLVFTEIIFRSFCQWFKDLTFFKCGRHSS